MWFRSMFPKPNRAARRSRNRIVCLLAVERLEDLCLPSFLDPVSYAVGHNPQAVVAGDFNNDTRTDLAVSNYSDGTVSVLLSNLDGTFQPARTTGTDGNPTSIAVGDFNADGQLDVVTGSASGYACDVMLGRGDGTFQSPASVGTYGLPNSVAVGDFNADGRLDIGVLTNVNDWYDSIGYANVLLGTGTGTFSAAALSYVGYGYHTSAAVADFDGDGRLDFAATSHFGTVDVALGTGAGYFGSSNSFAASDSYYDDGLSLIAADLNNDGRTDLATAAPTVASVSVLLGTGDGSFSTLQSCPAGQGARSLAGADFNGDGDTDLITANAGAGTVGVLLGTGTGTFHPPASTVVGGEPFGVAVGDFNGDGRPDAVTSDTNTNAVSVLLNDGEWPGAGTPAVTINDVTVTEGNTGTTGVTFTVTLSSASDQPVSVHYATVDGTAAAGDYQAASGTLTFAPGESSRTVTVLVNGDRVAEPAESFWLVLTNPTNAYVADAAGVGSIVDDEPHVSIDHGPVTVTEGNGGTTTAVFTVRLTTAYDAPVGVNYSTFEGDTDFPPGSPYSNYYPAATAGSDFAAQAGTLTFAPGETVKTVAVAVYGDRAGEPDEYLSLNLTGSSSAHIDAGHAVGVIVDDEPQVRIDPTTLVREGNSGTTAMSFTVTLSAASDLPVVVSYATADGSARAGSDYQAATGTLTFAPGETVKTFTVAVVGDRLAEPDEYLTAYLTGATNAQVAGDTSYGTILDDEPRIQISSAGVKEGNSGTRLMTFTVTLSAPYDQAVTVRYATQDGTAKAGEDYVATSGTLTFAPGQTTMTFTVAIKGDTKKEADESFQILLSDASSNAFIDGPYGYGDILNDDGRKR